MGCFISRDAMECLTNRTVAMVIELSAGDSPLARVESSTGSVADASNALVCSFYCGSKSISGKIIGSRLARGCTC